MERKWLLSVTVALLMWTNADSKHFRTFMGPFSLKLRRTEACPTEKEGNRNGTSFFFRDVRTHYKQDPTYTGNISLTYTFSDDLGGHMTLASWSSMGGWIDNAETIKMDRACSAAMLTIPSVWESFIFALLGEKLSCPFLPGIYRFSNFSLNFRKHNIKQFIYGRWRADTQSYVTKTKQVLGCMRWYIDTVPA